MANNTLATIQKILELKNINLWEFVYYGYSRCLVDQDFVIDFAVHYLASQPQPENPLTLKIACLVIGDQNELEPLLEQLRIDKEDLVRNRERLYNKLWFYITLAGDLKSLDGIC